MKRGSSAIPQNRERLRFVLQMLECPRAIVEPVEQVEEVVYGNEDFGELLFVVALDTLVDDVVPIFGSLVKRGNEVLRYRLLCRGCASR